MLHAICPICKKPLEKVGNSAVCKDGHSFDFAKEGYLNLLPSSKKHSQDPGDNKDMVLARKRFLDGGYYAPLADEISDIICKKQNPRPLTLIDAGVGTGFYLNKIITARATQLNDISRACEHAYAYNNSNAKHGNSDVYLGADISKTAVRYASKLNPSAECYVASVYDLPYHDNIADVVTCIFSPYALSEYHRVLNPDGILIVASPCENHLIELRRALYENVRAVESSLKTDGFEIVYEHELAYSFTLKNKEDVSALLMMTPYAYRAPKDKVNSVLNTNSLELTADFKISVLKPKFRQC